MKRIAVVALFLVAVAGCEPSPTPDSPQKPRTYFALGQIVKHKTSGARGQVVKVWEGYNPPQYDVRFAIEGYMQQNTFVLKGFTTECLYDFEMSPE